MDSLTHLVAGALTPMIFPRAPRRAMLAGFGIVAGEFPDIDIFSGSTPDHLLVVHRGITHALALQPVLALCLVLPFYLLLHRRQRVPIWERAVLEGAVPECAGGGAVFFPQARFAAGAPCPGYGNAGALRRLFAFLRRFFHSFGLGAMFCAALFALLTHVYLDCMTTFGTQALLPFSPLRVWYSSMFIVDLQLTLPALALLVAAWMQKPAPGVLFSGAQAGAESGARTGMRRDTGAEGSIRFPGASVPAVARFSPRARRLACAGLIWILLYPLASLGVNGLLTPSLARRYAGNDPGRLTLLTEPFSPYVWKIVVDDGLTYRMGTAFPFSGNAARLASFAKADPALLARFGAQHPIFLQFRDFCAFMVQRTRDLPEGQPGGGRRLTEYVFMDLRYIFSPDSPARWFGRSDPNFILEARADENGTLHSWRFLTRGNRSAPWEPVHR